MQIITNKYIDFEYSLFNELFLLMRHMCSKHIQSYHMHLLWHGIDICTEIFIRKMDKTISCAFRQSRQLLLAWIAFIIDKINSNDYEFVAGLCDLRCYTFSDIRVDKNLLDKNSIGPQIPPPTRLRLQHKKCSLKDRLTKDLLKPFPIIPYGKIEKKPFKEGKLTEQHLILEDRWKSFDEFKEMKYIRIFLKLLINNKGFFQYEKPLENLKNILQRRYHLNLSFAYTDNFILNLLTESTKHISLYVTLPFTKTK